MVEEVLRAISEVLVAVIEVIGVAIIGFGAFLAASRFLVEGLRHRSSAVFIPIRLSLGRYLTLGLEFQLAADILRTATAPTMAQIGQLAAVAAIRTGLNYFLRREAEHERQQQRASQP